MPKLTIDIVGQLANFQDSLNRVERQAAGIGQRLESAFGGVKVLFAGLATAVAGIGFGRLIKDSIDTADALNKMAQRTGVSVESLSALQYGAKLSDVSVENLEMGLRFLAKTMGDGSDAFKTLGINTRESSGALRGTDAVLADLADAFQKLPDGATKSALAMKLLGARTGTELIPLLNGGSAGLREFTAEADRLGVTVSSKTARAAEELNDNITRLRTALQGVGNLLASTILPPLSRFTQDLLDAAKASGSLSGGLLAVITGQAGNDAGRKLIEVEDRIKSIRAEREKLKGTIGDSDFARSIPGLSRSKDLEYEESSLLVLRDRLKVLQTIRAERLSTENAPAKVKADLVLEDPNAASARARARATAERELEASVREVGRITAAAAKDRAEVAEAYNQIELDAQQKADDEKIRLAQKTQATLDALLGDTQIGRVKKLREELDVLAKAGANAPLEQQAQYEQAFEELNNKIQKASGVSADGFHELSTKGQRDIDQLKQAFEGFGRRSADVFAEFVVSGKASFSDLIQSIIKDLVSLIAYKAVLGPIFGAIGGSFGGLFGSGGGGGGGLFSSAKGNVFSGAGISAFSGSVVSRPTVFPFAHGTGLMGEAGPEAILPLKRGAGGRLGVEASGGGGGDIIINQNNNFYGGADPATMTQWGQAVKADTLATLAQQRRRGQI